MGPVIRANNKSLFTDDGRPEVPQSRSSVRFRSTTDIPRKPGNLVLGTRSDDALLRQLAAVASGTGAHMWPQLGHAGALAHQPISRPAGSSALASQREPMFDPSLHEAVMAYESRDAARVEQWHRAFDSGDHNTESTARNADLDGN